MVKGTSQALRWDNDQNAKFPARAVLTFAHIIAINVDDKQVDHVHKHAVASHNLNHSLLAE
jgi:hypothetical protein